MGARGRMSLLLAMALMGMSALGNPIDNTANETEIENDYLEDALGNWLGNFGTYTFMVEQDVDDSPGEDLEDLVPHESSEYEEMEEEGEEEDYDQGSSAPIALGIKRSGGFLNPDIDYTIKLESLVAEEGSMLVTLGNFENKTSCGVGGFTLPLESSGRGGVERRLNINHQQDGNRSTTIVAFAVNTNEEETTTTWTVGDEGSAWEELGENLWWATGKLVGGGLLSLTFTPPECGCLLLRAHYALPLGDNLTLVVGPEAYPMDLEKLLCIDPAYSHSIVENLIEPEGEEGNVTQDSLGDPDDLQEADDDLESSDRFAKIGRGRGRGRGHGRGKFAARKARFERKKKRQEARQAIRQAGRRMTKKRVRKQMRLRATEDASEDNGENRPGRPNNGRKGGRWARKQARKAARKQRKQGKKFWKGRKPWKNHGKHAHKHGQRNRHNRRNRHNWNQNTTEDATPDPTEAFEEHLDDEDYLNSTEPQSEEDALADILLSEEEEEVEEGPQSLDEAVSNSDAPVGRRGRQQQRKRGRGQNKWINKEKKKGIQFCCKQGIKFKKSLLLITNSIEEDQPEILCNDTNDIINTFAKHKFGIENASCASRFETCCSKFTLQLWENIKAKKAAKKSRRKQKRKESRKQKRKQHRSQRQSSTASTTSVNQ